LITIESKEYLPEFGGWHVQAHVELASGSRRCTHLVEVSEESSDDEIKAAILALYQPAKGK
jgi:hypothetical protein